MFYEPYLKNASVYIEKNGNLYRKIVEIPANYSGMLVEYKMIKKESDYIEAELEYMDELMGEKYTIKIIIAYQNGKWLVDNLEQIWK